MTHKYRVISNLKKQNFELLTNTTRTQFAIRNTGGIRILAGYKDCNIVLTNIQYTVNKDHINYNNVLNSIINDYFDLFT